MLASSLTLRPPTMARRLGSTWSASFCFKSLSMSTTIERGTGLVESEMMLICSTPSSKMRNSSFFRSATRLPVLSLTVTGTTTLVVVVVMVAGFCEAGGGVCCSAGRGLLGLSWAKPGAISINPANNAVSTAESRAAGGARRANGRGHFVVIGPNFPRLKSSGQAGRSLGRIPRAGWLHHKRLRERSWATEPRVLHQDIIKDTEKT